MADKLRFIIDVQNQQKKVSIDPARIKKIVEKIFQSEGIKQFELSIVFVTDRKMKSLNRKYLGHDYETDVLSFDYSSGESGDSVEGEVVVSTITAWNNARKYNVPVKYEIVLYVIHGILHLMGYDDQSVLDREKMRKKEQVLLELVAEDISVL